MLRQQLVILFIFLASACSTRGQNPVKKIGDIDTVRLFNPHPNADDDVEPRGILYAAAMMQDRAAMVINGQPLRVGDSAGLLDSIARYADEIRAHRFFILTDSTTPFSRIMTVLTRLQTLKIENYRVVNAWNFYKPADPVITSPPPVITETRVQESPGDLRITVLAHTYKFLRDGKETLLKDTSQIAAFLDNPRQFDPGNHIYIFTYDDIKYERLQGLLNVLNDRKIYSFNLMTQSYR